MRLVEPESIRENPWTTGDDGDILQTPKLQSRSPTNHQVKCTRTVPRQLEESLSSVPTISMCDPAAALQSGSTPFASLRFPVAAAVLSDIADNENARTLASSPSVAPLIDFGGSMATSPVLGLNEVAAAYQKNPTPFTGEPNDWLTNMPGAIWLHLPQGTGADTRNPWLPLNSSEPDPDQQPPISAIEASAPDKRQLCNELLHNGPDDGGADYGSNKYGGPFDSDVILVEEFHDPTAKFSRKVRFLVSIPDMNTKVKRSFGDFEALSKILSDHYPFRAVPRMPQKKPIHLLRRFLLAIYMHPVLSHDPNFTRFLYSSLTANPALADSTSKHARGKFKLCPPIPSIEQPAVNEQPIPGFGLFIAQASVSLSSAINSLAHLATSAGDQIATETKYAVRLGRTAAAMRECGQRKVFCVFHRQQCQDCNSLDSATTTYCEELGKISALLCQQAEKSSKDVLEGLRMLEDSASLTKDLIKKFRAYEKYALGDCKSYYRRLSQTRIEMRAGANSGRSVHRLNEQLGSQSLLLILAENRISFTKRCVSEELEYWHTQAHLFSRLLCKFASESRLLAARNHNLCSTMLAFPSPRCSDEPLRSGGT